MSIRRTAAVVFSATALTLTACGGDDPAAGDATTTPAPDAGAAESPAPGTPAPGTGTPQEGGADGGTAGLPPRPQPDSCVTVPEAPDGRYTVYEAGTAVVTREGDRLVLGDVQAAEGWTARVDDEEDDEVEIDFRRDATDVLDLEVELDDGRAEVQICADDD